ncbi:MAG: uracil-DNA glycosylase [Gammaproteobacteria bacterium]|nr:uracil-DNA glycosylase [Gammaproteobacteria bacterium]MCF6229703.1 uracil-DNA glycosylase [Gammaproteobacteria bacterium]
MSQQQYLDAMGITLWQRRDMALPEHIKSGQALDAAPVAVAKLAPTSVDATQLNWAQMDAAVLHCQHCLHAEGKQKRLGCGHSSAEVMFIVAADDQASLSADGYFSGGAQHLFNNMLRAIGLSSQQVYLTAIVKCSPQGNSPLDEEAAAHCVGYLARQIALLRPKVIAVLGASAAQLLKNTQQMTDPVGDEPLSYGKEEIPLLMIHSPEQLLQNPLNKRQVWKDLGTLQKLLSSA